MSRRILAAVTAHSSCSARAQLVQVKLDEPEQQIEALIQRCPQLAQFPLTTYSALCGRAMVWLADLENEESDQAIRCITL